MSKFFINRPIVAMVIAILMVIVGAVTITSLPVAQFPNIVPPEVQVLATYVGADAQTIEQSVATPVEQQMSGVDNMNYMYSLNSTADGLMRLIVDYDVKTDPNTDLMLTQMIRRTLKAKQDHPCQTRGKGIMMMTPMETIKTVREIVFAELRKLLCTDCSLHAFQGFVFRLVID